MRSNWLDSTLADRSESGPALIQPITDSATPSTGCVIAVTRKS